MRDPKHQHHQKVILNPAYDAVCSDPVPPKSRFVTCHGFPKISRVALSGNPLLEELYDAPLDRLVELFQFD